MSAQIIDGKKISQDIRSEIKKEVEALKKSGLEPGLATILVGNDPASKVYVTSKIKTCAELGIRSYSHHLGATTSQKELEAIIDTLNKDPKVNGILVQLPLPAGLESDKILKRIDPLKDADGLHPENLGELMSAKSWAEISERNLVLSCTPHGVIKLLERTGIVIEGKKAVVIGRSNLVGKPVAMMLLAKNATVTMAHSKTKDLQFISSQADILIAAIGKPKFVTADFIKPGAVVIDVGTNRTPEGLVGDVDFINAKEIASFISPVPGGVGPMTITMLMQNTVNAAKRQRLTRIT
jgi:methylenetetrahydrofolate dehydrogenase (NADP+)/methenyltetrahydrofolate cyclohydrolase